MLGVLAIGGCIRFSSDVPVDASRDAGAAADAGSKADAVDGFFDDGDAQGKPGDASAEAAPICQRFDPAITLSVAGDLVSALLQDCKIQSAFVSLPPVRLQHFEECSAALVASVLGCVHADGTRFKYPAYDTSGEFCRDMKTAHAGLGASDGDFDAFLAALTLALRKNGLTDDEITRALRTFGAATTRADIVKLKEAGPTHPCDAGAETAADAGPGSRVEAGPDAAPESARTESGVEASID